MTDELERLAREAIGALPASSPDIALSAAASPDVILALLEERRVLREAAAHLVDAWDHFESKYEVVASFEELRAALQAEPARAEAKDGAAEDAMAADRAAALWRAEEGAS